MKYISLNPHHTNLNNHPIAQQINEILHDGINSACINYIDIDTLRNRLGNVNDDQLKSATKYLTDHQDLSKIHYHGRIFFTIN